MANTDDVNHPYRAGGPVKETPPRDWRNTKVATTAVVWSCLVAGLGWSCDHVADRSALGWALFFVGVAWSALAVVHIIRLWLHR